MEAESLYKMKPDPNEVFVPSQVEEIIKSVLEQHLTEATYNKINPKQLSQILCKQVQDKVKQLKLPRYRLVTQCVLGQVEGQGALVASRCLWDTETDNWASYTFKNSSLFCVMMVFGLYKL